MWSRRERPVQKKLLALFRSLHDFIFPFHYWNRLTIFFTFGTTRNVRTNRIPNPCPPLAESGPSRVGRRTRWCLPLSTQALLVSTTHRVGQSWCQGGKKTSNYISSGSTWRLFVRGTYVPCQFKRWFFLTCWKRADAPHGRNKSFHQTADGKSLFLRIVISFFSNVIFNYI
jgi:hypothetical protein